MRSHWTTEPYERIPDGQTVPSRELSGWRLHAWRVAFLACCVLVPVLIIAGAIWG